MLRAFIVVAALAVVAAPAVADAPASAEAAPVELVETAPIETSLDHADIPEAADVWRALIAGARHTIDLAEFYVTSAPGSRLVPVLDALVAAAARGVRVRLVVDDGFAKHESATLAELAATGKLEIRRLDMHARAGGILHAKYFIVDGVDAYLGSQNLDWRSLTHIQELGVRLHSRALAGALADVFATDWALAGGGDAAARVHAHAADRYPLVVGAGKARMELTPVASPRGWLPDESLWELPRLIALVDGARKSVRVQVLTERSDELEAALERAAARGVTVELIVADWCKRKGCVEGLQRLARVPNLRVAFLDIPPWSGGFLPYARVAHAKYLVVDGERAWVGTSNVGLIIAGGALPARLDAFFVDNWKSAYAERVDPAAQYTPPRTH
jgi:phosphatidylserine/phosphatidylglycerophosphate/cardiolipin synthase-like enzyme